MTARLSGTGVIWASLPLPALLIDAADHVRDVNPAAETFLNPRARSIVGTAGQTACRHRRH